MGLKSEDYPHLRHGFDSSFDLKTSSGPLGLSFVLFLYSSVPQEEPQVIIHRIQTYFSNSEKYCFPSLESGVIGVTR